MNEKVGKPVKRSRSAAAEIGKALSRKPAHQPFKLWVVGDSPLIVHAWSEKARREILAKQTKATKGGKEARDPEADFAASLYPIEGGGFGFPATAIKRSVLSAAHKDKGIARTTVLSSLWINAPFYPVRPAMPGAICDMPLLRLWGSEPRMREDMVRLGSGMTKTAGLSYRGQFWPWALLVTGRFNVDVLTEASLGYLFEEAGMSAGVGDWRPEKNGPFGTYHPAGEEESQLWDDFAAGSGPLPVAQFEEAA